MLVSLIKREKSVLMYIKLNNKHISLLCGPSIATGSVPPSLHLDHFFLPFKFILRKTSVPSSKRQRVQTGFFSSFHYIFMLYICCPFPAISQTAVLSLLIAVHMYSARCSLLLHDSIAFIIVNQRCRISHLHKSECHAVFFFLECNITSSRKEGSRYRSTVLYAIFGSGYSDMIRNLQRIYVYVVTCGGIKLPPYSLKSLFVCCLVF